MSVGFPTKVNYATGDILTAANMSDLSGTVNLLQSAQNAAGKNAFINGDFGVWQRGTSFSNPTNNSYSADRWYVGLDGTGATRTVSQQTFTPGTAPAAGYEGTYYCRYALSVAGTGNTLNYLGQRIEDVRTFAGQTITFSFWAKAAANKTIYSYANQNFGSGGSATVSTTITSYAITTSWARYYGTVTLPAITGKTIGTSSYLDVFFDFGGGSTFTMDIWGVQLEATSTTSNFQTATGTKQGELAACQRYYYRNTASAAYSAMSNYTSAVSTSVVDIIVPIPVQMRTYPSVLDYSTIAIQDGATIYSTGTWGLSASYFSTFLPVVRYTHGSAALTQYRGYQIIANNSSSGYIGLSAEL